MKKKEETIQHDCTHTFLRRGDKKLPVANIRIASEMSVSSCSNDAGIGRTGCTTTGFGAFISNGFGTNGGFVTSTTALGLDDAIFLAGGACSACVSLIWFVVVVVVVVLFGGRRRLTTPGVGLAAFILNTVSWSNMVSLRRSELNLLRGGMTVYEVAPV